MDVSIFICLREAVVCIELSMYASMCVCVCVCIDVLIHICVLMYMSICL